MVSKLANNGELRLLYIWYNKDNPVGSWVIKMYAHYFETRRNYYRDVTR